MTNLFGHSVRSDLLALFVAEAMACFAAFAAILALGLPEGAPPHGIAPLLGLAGGLALCVGLAGGAVGLYQPENRASAARLAAGTAIAALLVLAAGRLALPPVLGLDPTDPASAPALLRWQALLLGAFVVAVLLTRLGHAVAERRGLLRRRLVAVGEAAPPRGDTAFLVVGTVPPRGDVEAALDPDRLRRQRVGLVLAEPAEAVPAALRDRLAARRIRVMTPDEFVEARSGRVNLARLPEGWLARAHASREGRLEGALRRTIDILLGLGLLVGTLPVWALAALAVKLDSPGPLFYRQERVGRDGRVFTLCKFRSMVADAERAGSPVWATQRDPRVTRVGRFLRLTRIDELPQVLNVLRGDMAFVGPRPERPQFVAELSEVIPHYADRHVVKPGITGWAQVNYPYGASVEDARQKLAYDLYYVRRRSLFLDLLIVVATVRVVLFREGSR